MRTVKKLIVVGDRILITPEDPKEMTKAGLYLPPGIQEKEKIQGGYVVKVGPGYPIANPAAEDEPWSMHKETARYIPLQAEEGDYAIFLRSQAIEIEFEGNSYVIVPQSAVLLLVRNELLENDH
ncbi:MAG: co-chaperone GroES family protein [Bacteroidota bacterium]|nr:co-chaperone GroES family protein [Bacteroidota bacterium]